MPPSSEHPNPRPAPMVVTDEATCVIDGYTLLPPTSITLVSGECLVLEGANGSGKTTFLRLIAGLLKPSSGRVLVGGVPPDNRCSLFRQSVSALIGTPHYYHDLTIGEHYLLVGATWSIPERAEASTAMLTKLGLLRLRDRFPHELSSGQKQLFTLGATFFRPSKLLILDEPEQRLDAEHRAVLMSLLETEIAQGTTIVLATHNAELSGRVASRVVALRNQEGS